MGQTHHDEIVLFRDRSLAVHHVDGIAAGIRLADLQHAMIQLNVGVDLALEAVNELLVAVLDRIEADIAFDIHHEILERVEAVCVVRFGCDVGSRHHFQKALGDRVGDFAIQQFLATDVGPRVLVIVCADAFVVFDRRHHARARLAEILDRLGCRGAVFAAHARHVVEQLAVELHLFGVHRNGLQAEVLHEFAQRIGASHGVIVNLGDAGFVHRGRGIEFFREDFAADAIGCLIDGDAAKRSQLLLEVPGAHQPTWAATYDREIKHSSSFVPACVALSRLRAAKSP